MQTYDPTGDDWEKTTRRAVTLGGISSLIMGLLVVGAIALCIGSILGIINVAFRSSAVYEEAMARARSNRQVIEALGEPIEPGLLIWGEISTGGLSGEADLRIPIHGPEGRGTLYAQARREMGAWHYYTLAVVVRGSDKIIDLR